MLTEQQKQAVKLLFEGLTVRETASALGMHRSTVYRWMSRKSLQKEWKREWRRLATAFLHDIREETGYYERLRQYHVSVRKYKRRLDKAAENGTPAEVDKAYDEWKEQVFKKPLF